MHNQRDSNSLTCQVRCNWAKLWEVAFPNPAVSIYTLPYGDISAAYLFLDMLKSHPGDPFNCPYNLGGWMAFLLTNTSFAVLPSSLGGHKLCPCVLPPFTLPVRPWATVLCMSKLPKHLSVICKYWHKPSVNRFLTPVWRRVALVWSVQFAVFLIAGNQLQQPNFHFAHTPCLGEVQLMLYMVTAGLSFSKSVSSLALHTSRSSHPPPQRALPSPRHPSEECVTTNTSKTRKWSLLIHKLLFLKERTVRLNCKHFCEHFFLKRGRSSNAANNAIFDTFKINIIWFSSDTALLGR